MVSIPLDIGPALVDRSPPTQGGLPLGALLVLPGATCPASAYRWLAPLAHAVGFGCAWLARPPAAAGGPALVTIRAVLAAEAALRRRLDEGNGRLWSVGHSWGSAVLLECLDPAEASHDPRSDPPPDFAGVTRFEAVAALGTTLRPNVAGMPLPYRDAHRPLFRPPATRLLLVAGGCYGLATTALVKVTALQAAQTPSLLEALFH